MRILMPCSLESHDHYWSSLLSARLMVSQKDPRKRTLAFNVGEVEIAVASPRSVRHGTMLVKSDPQE